jgi:hypothetical protein
MYLAELMAIPVGAEIMKVHPWIAFAGGPVSIGIGLILTMIFVEETFPAAAELQQQIDVIEGGDLEWQRPNVKTLRLRAHQALDGVAEGARWMTHNISAMLVLSTFLFSMFARQVLDILLQYVSKEFHWSFAKVKHTEWSALYWLKPLHGSLLADFGFLLGFLSHVPAGCI